MPPNYLMWNLTPASPRVDPSHVFAGISNLLCNLVSDLSDAEKVRHRDEQNKRV
jgi:hypothetical protein